MTEETSSFFVLFASFVRKGSLNEKMRNKQPIKTKGHQLVERKRKISCSLEIDAFDFALSKILQKRLAPHTLKVWLSFTITVLRGQD